MTAEDKPAPPRDSRWIVPLLLGVAAVALVYRLPAVQRWLSHRRIEALWSQFSGCMIGPPLTANESVTARFHATALTAMGLGEKAMQDWQRACAAPARDLDAALDAAGLGKTPLGRDMDGIVTTLAEGTVPELLARESWFEQTWASARTMDLVAEGDHEARHPPANPFGPADVPVMMDARWKTSLQPFDRVRGLRAGITLARDDMSAFCAFGPDGDVAFGKASCWRTRVLAGPLELSPANAAPLDASPILHGDIGHGLHEVGADRLLLDHERARAGYLRSDGFAVTAKPADGKIAVRRRIGTQVEELEVPSAGENKPMLMIGRELVWVAKERVMAASVPDGPEPIGPAVEIGASRGGVYGCSVPGTTVVALVDEGYSAVAFRTPGGWTQLHELEHGFGDLVCSASEAGPTATLTLIGGDTVDQARCTPEGCTTAKIGSLGLTRSLHDNADVSMMDATDLDGKLLVVWRAGYAGGIRMRRGPMDAFGKARETVIFDDQAGQETVVHRLVLLGGGPAAIVLIEAGDGLRAIHIAADGVFSPMSAKTEKL